MKHQLICLGTAVLFSSFSLSVESKNLSQNQPSELAHTSNFPFRYEQPARLFAQATPKEQCEKRIRVCKDACNIQATAEKKDACRKLCEEPSC